MAKWPGVKLLNVFDPEPLVVMIVKAPSAWLVNENELSPPAATFWTMIVPGQRTVTDADAEASGRFVAVAVAVLF
jgi:hypothetical protein